MFKTSKKVLFEMMKSNLQMISTNKEWMRMKNEKNGNKVLNNGHNTELNNSNRH